MLLEYNLNAPQKQLAGFFFYYFRCVESWCLEVTNQRHPLFIIVSWEDWNDSSFQSNFLGWIVNLLLNWVLTEWMCRAPTERWQHLGWCWLACTQVFTYFYTFVLRAVSLLRVLFLQLFLLLRIKKVLFWHSHFVTNYLVLGKEKISPSRSTDANPAAPDSESVIVAMERVSVLFDRWEDKTW